MVLLDTGPAGTSNEICSEDADGYASINSERKHPPMGKPPGKSFEVVKSPARGQSFPAKACPQGVFWRIWSAFPFNRHRNFGILQKSSLEKNWKAVQVFFVHTLSFQFIYHA